MQPAHGTLGASGLHVLPGKQGHWLVPGFGTVGQLSMPDSGVQDGSGSYCPPLELV